MNKKHFVSVVCALFLGCVYSAEIQEPSDAKQKKQLLETVEERFTPLWRPYTITLEMLMGEKGEKKLPINTLQKLAGKSIKQALNYVDQLNRSDKKELSEEEAIAFYKDVFAFFLEAPERHVAIAIETIFSQKFPYDFFPTYKFIYDLLDGTEYQKLHMLRHISAMSMFRKGREKIKNLGDIDRLLNEVNLFLNFSDEELYEVMRFFNVGPSSYKQLEDSSKLLKDLSNEDGYKAKMLVDLASYFRPYEVFLYQFSFEQKSNLLEVLVKVDKKLRPLLIRVIFQSNFINPEITSEQSNLKLRVCFDTANHPWIQKLIEDVRKKEGNKK